MVRSDLYALCALMVFVGGSLVFLNDGYSAPAQETMRDAGVVTAPTATSTDTHEPTVDMERNPVENDPQGVAVQVENGSTPTPQILPTLANKPDTPAVRSLSPKEQSELVAIHNRARSSENIEPLVWSTVLEKSAEVWADALKGRECAISHSDTAYGENIYFSRKYGVGQTPRIPLEVMSSFLEEKPYYNTKTGECAEGKICGHYTQIMWNTTTAVGCARSLCVDNERKEVWVCHYSPPGNVEGMKPF